MTRERQRIWFLLNGEPITTRVHDPTQNVLTYLRRIQGLTGTKEGCAEGDCGACTIVVGECNGERLQMRTLNACLLFVPVLDGKALFTVEFLRRMSGKLHPVQQAMIDCHGSQCGFCTPGFVMSLWQKYNECFKANRQPGRQELADHLSGNLCRCTGYKPILEAGQRMFDLPTSVLDEQSLVDALRGYSRQSSLQLPGADKREPSEADRSVEITARFAAPRSLAELTQLRAERPAATLLAGATDIGLWVNKLTRPVSDLLYLGCVPELKCIEIDDGQLRIGAAVTLTDAYDCILEHYPQLQQIALRFASVPIRNAGTLGGNVANGSPIGDSAPWLLALAAEIELVSELQVRRIPIDALYTGYRENAIRPGELLSSILVPLPAEGQRFRCYKLSKRFDSDISAVCGAFALQMRNDRIVDARVAYGGMAATVRRASACEAELLHAAWSEQTVQAASTALADDYTPMSDLRATAGYRLRAAQNLLRRFFLETRLDNPLPVSQTTVFARNEVPS